MKENSTNTLYGILAEFRNPAELVKAAKSVNMAGYTKYDTYSPYPIHGMPEAMGLKKSKVGWIVLTCGLIGLIGALWLMMWVQGWNYPLNISGKPYLNYPVYVPIAFELTVLLSAFGALFGMLGLNGLPKPYHPLFNSARFNKATDNGFFLCIESNDDLFAEEKTQKLLQDAGATNIEKVFG